MTFSFNDAWLAQAIHYSVDGEGIASLRSVIAYADYSNHAVMTYEECCTGLQRLTHAGLITILDQRIHAKALSEWWTGRLNNIKDDGTYKAFPVIKSCLMEDFSHLDNNMADCSITADAFQQSVSDYLGR